jgi:hypothetical protein
MKDKLDTLLALALVHNWTVDREMGYEIAEVKEFHGTDLIEWDEDFAEEIEEEYDEMMYVFRKDGTVLTYNEESGSYFNFYDALQVEPDPLETYWREAIADSTYDTFLTENIKRGSIREPNPNYPSEEDLRVTY